MLVRVEDACFCRCHLSAAGTRYAALQMDNPAKVFRHARRMKYHEPPDVHDPLEAAVSCIVCRRNHVPALLSTTLPNEDEPRSVSVAEFCAWQDDATGEGGE
jgi:hypothetical protein